MSKRKNRVSEKSLKNFEKRLDKLPEMWYNKEVVTEEKTSGNDEICILKTEQCEKE